MNICVERNLKFPQYVYAIKQEPTCFGKVNYTYGIKLRKMFVYDKKENLCLKQENCFLKIINILPFFMFYNFPAFIYYKNDIKSGKTYVNPYSRRKLLTLEHNTYEVYLHNNNYISIMKNDVQIAIVKKHEWTDVERHKYDVNYDEKRIHDMKIILLLIMYVDIIFFSNHFTWSYKKYEKTIGLKEKYPERISWMPPIKN